MSIKIVTGYTGEPHVTAQQDRYINQSFLGTGNCVLPIGNQLACTIVDATHVSIADGGVSIQGCVGIMDAGETETLVIHSGQTGYNRTDYVVARYDKWSNGTETVCLMVKEGTPSAGTPSAPDYVTGSIEEGDDTVDAPLWKINVEGLTIASVERIAPVSQTAASLKSTMDAVTSLASGKTPFFAVVSGSDLVTALGSVSTGGVFVFRGSGTFSQDVLRLSTQVNAFGIAYKNSSTQCVMLSACGGKLYYATYKIDGTGSAYCPLNLLSNIEE